MVAHGDVRPAGCVGNTALAWMAMDDAVPGRGEHRQRHVRRLAADHLPRAQQRLAAGILRHHIFRRHRASGFGAHVPHHPRPHRQAEPGRGEARPRFRCAQRRHRAGGRRVPDRSPDADYPGLFDLLAKHRIEVALDTGWPITGWTSEIRAQCLLGGTLRSPADERGRAAVAVRSAGGRGCDDGLRRSRDAQGRACHRQARPARRVGPAPAAA